MVYNYKGSEKMSFDETVKTRQTFTNVNMAWVDANYIHMQKVREAIKKARISSMTHK